MSSGLKIMFSDETAVRGRRVIVLAKLPVWNLLRARRRSPFEDLGSIDRELVCWFGDSGY